MNNPTPAGVNLETPPKNGFTSRESIEEVADEESKVERPRVQHNVSADEDDISDGNTIPMNGSQMLGANHNGNKYAGNIFKGDVMNRNKTNETMPKRGNFATKKPSIALQVPTSASKVS